RADVRRDVGDGIVRLDVHVFGRADYTPPRQFGIVCQAELQRCRQLEVRIDDVDLAAGVGRTDACWNGRRARLVERIGTERGAGRVRTRVLFGRDHAIVDVRVGQPHGGRQRLEQTHAAVQLRLALGIEVVIEAQARLDDHVLRA